jgi:hypothetical protein
VTMTHTLSERRGTMLPTGISRKLRICCAKPGDRASTRDNRPDLDRDGMSERLTMTTSQVQKHALRYQTWFSSPAAQPPLWLGPPASRAGTRCRRRVAGCDLLHNKIG